MINFEFTKSNGNNTEGKIKITIEIKHLGF